MIVKFLTASLVFNISMSSFAADTVPGEQAAKSGFSTCQKTVEGIAKFIVKSNAHASLASWNTKNVDDRLFNSLLTTNFDDGISFSTLNVTPTKSGKCDSSYTTVSNFDISCSLLRETIFSEWKFAQELGGLVMLTNDSGDLKAIFLPSANGCTTIKTEVIYE